MSISRHWVSSLLLVQCLGCGSHSKSHPAAAPTELEGTWTAACHQPLLTTDWNVTEFQFQGNAYTETKTVYRDKDCATQGYKSVTHGTFAISGESGIASGAKNIDLTESSTAWTPFDDTALLYFNNGNGYCGVKNWKKGVTQTCTPTEDATRYSVFRMADQKLVFATMTASSTGKTGRTAETRFDKLEEQSSFTKK